LYKNLTLVYLFPNSKIVYCIIQLLLPYYNKPLCHVLD